MRSKWLAVVLTASAALTACGDEDKTDSLESTAKVGKHGGDCKDGDKSCSDQYGAKLCPVSSGYPGDDLALCDPKDEDEGILLHYGPKNYEDKDEVAKYLLGPYAEDENCVYVRSTNTKPVFFNRYHGRMRDYSHHLIVTVVNNLPEGAVEGEPTSCSQIDALGSRWLVGSQDPQIDIEIEGAKPGSKAANPGDPEYGLGQLLQPNTLLRLDLHYVNTTDKELLREGWVMLKTVPEDRVETQVDMITFFQGSINIAPGAKGWKTAIGRCRAPSDRYLGMVTGHFHENGTKFTMWHDKNDGTEPEKIYETSDWDVPGNAFYTPRIENPLMDGSDVWGATSGYRLIKAGEYVNFQCEYDNPSTSTVRLGELGKDQMCNVFGVYYPTDGDVWNCACAGTLCI